MRSMPSAARRRACLMSSSVICSTGNCDGRGVGLQEPQAIADYKLCICGVLVAFGESLLLDAADAELTAGGATIVDAVTGRRQQLSLVVAAVWAAHLLWVAPIHDHGLMK